MGEVELIAPEVEKVDYTQKKHFFTALNLVKNDAAEKKEEEDKIETKAWVSILFQIIYFQIFSKFRLINLTD